MAKLTPRQLSIEQEKIAKAEEHNRKHHKEHWDRYKHTNPNLTHPEIMIDVPIPSHWWSASYHNDVCPSFTFGKLQIFVMDRATKERESLPFKYTVMYEDDYGCSYDPLLETDKWSEVLKFVEKNHKGDKK